MVFGGLINYLMGRMMPSTLSKGSKVLGLGGETLGQTASILVLYSSFIIGVPLESHLNSQCLSFLICAMGMIIEPSS